MKHDDLELRSWMFDTYVLVNVVGLLAPHPAIRALKSRRAATLELTMAQHVMQMPVAPRALWTSIPDSSSSIVITRNIRPDIRNRFLGRHELDWTNFHPGFGFSKLGGEREGN